MGFYDRHPPSTGTNIYQLTPYFFSTRYCFFLLKLKREVVCIICWIALLHPIAHVLFPDPEVAYRAETGAGVDILSGPFVSDL